MNRWMLWMLVLQTWACSSSEQSTSVPSASTSESAANPGDVDLCDGTDDFTFQYVGLNRAIGGPTRLWWRNGAPFLRIDGRCRAWIMPRGENSTILTATLSRDDARRLSNEVDMVGWAEFDGIVAEVETGEAPFMLLADQVSSFACEFDCKGRPISGDKEDVSTLRPVFEAASRWLAELSEIGTPVDGPVRVAVTPIGLSVWNWPFVEWPLERTVSEFVVMKNEVTPASYLLEGSDAEALRGLRRRVTEQGDWPISYGWTAPIEWQGEAHDVLIVDTLPHEDIGGVVPWVRSPEGLQLQDP